MSDTENLKKLGSGKTTYKYDKPDKKILETFVLKHDDFLVPFKCNEFTSLCPKTGQPDYAKIEIIYVPDKKGVESKSLKLYLGSFRQHGSFHEDVINRIYNDLNSVLNPMYLRVIGDFSVRGGISIKPIVIGYGTLNLNKQRFYDHLAETYDRIKSNLQD